MSKIIERYKELKNNDESKIYLFESGVFYLMYNDDAELANNLLNLKLVGLSETDCKCGFPIRAKDKYLSLFDKNNISYEIIKSERKETYKKKINIEHEIVRKLKSINIEYYTPSEALDFLKELKELLND